MIYIDVYYVCMLTHFQYVGAFLLYENKPHPHRMYLRNQLLHSHRRHRVTDVWICIYGHLSFECVILTRTVTSVQQEQLTVVVDHSSTDLMADFTRTQNPILHIIYWIWSPKHGWNLVTLLLPDFDDFSTHWTVAI